LRLAAQEIMGAGRFVLKLSILWQLRGKACARGQAASVLAGPTERANLFSA
jgi:hypothetical protein